MLHSSCPLFFKLNVLWTATCSILDYLKGHDPPCIRESSVEFAIYEVDNSNDPVNSGNINFGGREYSQVMCPYSFLLFFHLDFRFLCLLSSFISSVSPFFAICDN